MNADQIQEKTLQKEKGLSRSPEDIEKILFLKGKIQAQK